MAGTGKATESEAVGVSFIAAANPIGGDNVNEENEMRPSQTGWLMQVCKSALVMVALVTTLTGCVHPCYLVSCYSFVEAVAVAGDDGSISIDIPAFKDLGHTAELLSLSVDMKPAATDTHCCWEIMATLPRSKTKISFPIRYGQDIEGMKATFPAMPLEKGRRYLIFGKIRYFENETLRVPLIEGKFEYGGKSVSSDK